MTVEGRHKGAEHHRLAADQLMPVIRELPANGERIARELERRGIKTARRGAWSHK